MAKKWNGKGVAPSRKAAIDWLVSKGFDRDEVEEAIPAVRNALEASRMAQRIAADPAATSEGGIDLADIPNINPLNITRDGDSFTVRASAPPHGRKYTGGGTRNPDERRSGDGDRRSPQQKIEDMTAEEIASAAESGELEGLLGDIGGPGSVDTRGAPLWRYETSDPEQLAGLTVKDQSRSAVDIRDDEGRLVRSGIDQGERDSRRGRPWLKTATGSRTGARYFEQDTLEPLKWSAEQRADLQRVLSKIGLYGKDAKIRLGSWTARDQAVYAEVLASANEEGLTWLELLNKWKRTPPEDILAEINGGSGSGSGERPPLVIQRTNPIDVQETARDVSRALIGREDRGFIGATPGGYNQIEVETQTAAYNATDPEGSGGTVTDAPSVTAYAADQLRRTKPTEVNSYATLGAFNEVLRQLGLAG